MTWRIAFAVGDTAGHVMPALALAEAWEAAADDVEVLLLAAAEGPAAGLAAKAGRRIAHVPASPLARARPVARLGALAQLVVGIPAARRILRRVGTRLVIGTGGYASGTVLLAARSLGLATAIVEPNVVPGLANRLLAPLAGRAYVGCEDTARFFPARRTVVTGLPVSPSIVRRLCGHTLAFPSPGPIHVLVTGASRGERFLGAEMPGVLAAVQRLGARLEVRHQCGALGASDLAAAYAERGVQASVAPFLDDLADAYLWAHFVVARAGAGTLAELALAGLPALIVPLADAAADHQSANAMHHASAGAALWCRESDWDRHGIARDVFDLLSSRPRWHAMTEAARRLARPDAAVQVVDDCQRLMEGRW